MISCTLPACFQLDCSPLCTKKEDSKILRRICHSGDQKKDIVALVSEKGAGGTSKAIASKPLLTVRLTLTSIYIDPLRTFWGHSLLKLQQKMLYQMQSGQLCNFMKVNAPLLKTSYVSSPQKIWSNLVRPNNAKHWIALYLPKAHRSQRMAILLRPQSLHA